MSSIFGFILMAGVVVFLGWNIYSLVVSIRDRKNRKNVKNQQEIDKKDNNG